MKFKALFFIFNIVFAAIFITVFFLPMSLLGEAGLNSFWGRHWALGALFTAIVATVNVMFALWWRLLSLLENQDWAGLVNYLEKKVYNRAAVTASTIKLFLEASFLMGDFEGILKLSDRLGSISAEKQAKFSHKIAAALIVGGKYVDARDLCLAVSGNSAADPDWNRFFTAFAIAMIEGPYPSKSLAELSDTARDPIAAALSGYLNSKPGRDNVAAQRARNRILGKYNRKKWDSLLQDAGTGIHVIVLSSLVKEATAWLFGAPAGEKAAI